MSVDRMLARLGDDESDQIATGSSTDHQPPFDRRPPYCSPSRSRSRSRQSEGGESKSVCSSEERNKVMKTTAALLKSETSAALQQSEEDLAHLWRVEDVPVVPGTEWWSRCVLHSLAHIPAAIVGDFVPLEVESACAGTWALAAIFKATVEITLPCSDVGVCVCSEIPHSGECQTCPAQCCGEMCSIVHGCSRTHLAASVSANLVFHSWYGGGCATSTV